MLKQLPLVIVFAACCMAGSPAFAYSTESASVSAGGAARFADPDAQLDALSDQLDQGSSNDPATRNDSGTMARELRTGTPSAMPSQLPLYSLSPDN